MRLRRCSSRCSSDALSARAQSQITPGNALFREIGRGGVIDPVEWLSTRLNREGQEGTADRQNNRPGAAIAEHTLIWPMSWTGPCPPSCYASVGHAAAEVPDFGIRARTVCNAGDPVGRLPSFPDDDFRPTTPPNREIPAQCPDSAYFGQSLILVLVLAALQPMRQ